MWGKEFTYKEKNLHKENKWKHEQKDKIKISKKMSKNAIFKICKLLQ